MLVLLWFNYWPYQLIPLCLKTVNFGIIIKNIFLVPNTKLALNNQFLVGVYLESDKQHYNVVFPENIKCQWNKLNNPKTTIKVVIKTYISNMNP